MNLETKSKFMRYKQLLAAIVLTLGLFSCDKKKPPVNPPPPSATVQLKDITIAGLPSPYYSFEYNFSGQVIIANYSGGIRMYDILYGGNAISELRNNTPANKDRMQYIYGINGKPELVKYFDENNLQFKRAFITFNAGGQLQKIEWERNMGIGFQAERTVSFIYYPDGNLLELTDHHHPIGSQQELSITDRFEQYDDKINQDAFSLFHANNDHLLLLPTLKLQKNNPKKLIRTGTGINYTIDYTYTYNDKNTPLTKFGDVLFTSGPDAGQRFQQKVFFSYY
jgi:hypothetical protein